MISKSREALRIYVLIVPTLLTNPVSWTVYKPHHRIEINNDLAEQADLRWRANN